MTLFELRGFEAAYGHWVAREDPPRPVRYKVVDWAFTRQDDPYAGFKREVDMPNYWSGTIPGTLHGTGQVVVCTYWIYENERLVKIDMIATLNTGI